jgi:RNA polymerase sigma-70 factor (ECF subfamily)
MIPKSKEKEFEFEFKLFCKDYSDFFLHIILKKISNPEDAKEILQDAFLKFWKKFGGLDSHNAKVSYFTKTISTTIIDYYRKKGNLSNHHNNNYEPLSSAESKATNTTTALDLISFNDLLKSLEEFIETNFSMMDKEIIEKSFYDGMNDQEIANELGRAKKTIQNRKGPIRKVLSSFFNNHILLIILICCYTFSAKF